MEHPPRSRSILGLALPGALLVASCSSEYEPPAQAEVVPTGETPTIVEASGGQWQFGLPGTGCDLAVRIGGRSYYVEGSGIADHGDAHGPEGLCNAIRMAVVEGNLEDGRFIARSFEVLPVDTAE